MTTTDAVAVIGAGIAGLACARRLGDHGVTVTVFDKARAPAGRCATRRAETGTFDHGAQYFTARSAAFHNTVAAGIRQGRIAPWGGRIVALGEGGVQDLVDRDTRFVAVPTMSALARGLAEGLDVRTGYRVGHLRCRADGWHLYADDGRTVGPFARVVVSAPGAQAARLLAPAATLAERAATVRFAPCWAVMLTFAERVALDFDGAFVDRSFTDTALSWVARDSSKPGRPAGERWVLHAGPQWSAAHINEGPRAITAALGAALGAALPTKTASFPAPIAASAHLWRYALPTEPLPDRCLHDPASGLGACGDWCGGPRIEGAWQSGTAMADHLLR